MLWNSVNWNAFIFHYFLYYIQIWGFVEIIDLFYTVLLTDWFNSYLECGINFNIDFPISYKNVQFR